MPSTRSALGRADPDEIGVEALVARRDRRMDREDAVPRDLLEGRRRGRRRPPPARAPAPRAGTPSGPR